MIAKIFVLIFSIIIIIVAIIMVKQYIKCKKLDNIRKANIKTASAYLYGLSHTELSLEGLYCTFREIIQNLDISFILSSYGTFRAKSLDSCRMSDIYLGDIYGLWTKSLDYWVNCSDVEAVNIVTNQFRNILISTLNFYIQHEKSK